MEVLKIAEKNGAPGPKGSLQGLKDQKKKVDFVDSFFSPRVSPINGSSLALTLNPKHRVWKVFAMMFSEHKRKLTVIILVIYTLLNYGAPQP